MKNTASTTAQTEQAEQLKMSRLFAWVMICGGIGTSVVSLFDFVDGLLTPWDFYMVPLTSTAYFVSGLMIYFRPKWLTAAILLSAIPTCIYQQGVMFLAVQNPSAASYYAAAASGAFFPLLYLVLFITLPNGAARISWLNCAGFYVQFLLNATLFAQPVPSADRIAAEHILVQAMMAHPVYVLALSYIVRLRERLHATQQEAHQNKQNFLAMMSHEIRNLLQTMVGAIDLLDLKLKDPAERRNTARLQAAAAQLQTYLKDINELTKLEDPALRIHNRRFDLAQLLGDIHDEWLPRAQSKSLQFTLDLPDGQSLFIHTDEARLRQIVVNLVSNALKYTEAGSVSIRAAPDNDKPDYVVIEVHDTGIGIDEKYAEKIFQPYIRLENAKRSKAEGSGLGLPIVQRLVASLGGTLQFESGLNRGSRFVVSIPGLEANAAVL